MMRALIAAALHVAGPATAQEGGPFSANSEARSWGLVGEESARFTAQVVDILCELTGDCPADCGAGNRQLGLIREVDNVLIPVNKNTQPAFNGAVTDLLPYCNEMVEVDGLMVGDDEVDPSRFYQVQLIRRLDEEEFSPTNRWTRVWAEENPDAAGEGPWFRREPRIQALIARDGYLGLGLEVDEAFIADWFQ
ncbi:MAG: hypothetical protein AAGE18_18350 [Pseudomonadota bacterium]